MQLVAIIAEVEAAAQQEAASVHILETTHWEREAPDLLPGSLACLAAAKRRREALVEAGRLLREQEFRARCEKAKSSLVRFRDALTALRDLPRRPA